MTVSVVVATYRRDESLRAALLSLTEQTYADVEIVLVDDNADAEWNEKVQTILNDFPTVVYIRNESNRGSAETRNIGIRAASGEYVTFLDDDDVYLPHKIEKQVELMCEKKADYSITDLFLYNERDQLEDRRVRDYIRETDTASLLKYHLLHHITGTDTLMFRKEYLECIGGFDPIDVGDEYYLMYKAIQAGGSFCYLEDCDVKAYIHTGEGGLSSGDGKIQGENALYEFKKAHYAELGAKDRRYIRMRHYAVLAFAYLRRRAYGAFLRNAICSFASSPLQCVSLFLKR